MKSCTENIYKQKINQVIDYINYNLHQPLQLNVIADKVNMSKRQLLRVMALALDEPLYTYVDGYEWSALSCICKQKKYIYKS